MARISVDLNKKEIEQLEWIADKLNRTPDEAAKLILAAGCAYLGHAARQEAPDGVVSVMIHGLLKVPQIPTENFDQAN